MTSLILLLYSTGLNQMFTLFPHNSFSQVILFKWWLFPRHVLCRLITLNTLCSTKYYSWAR